MYNVQLTGSKIFDSQILMHSSTQNDDVSLAKYLQKHLSKEHQKNLVIDKVKHRKISSKRKWTDRDYHVKDTADVAHKEVKIYCNMNQ